MRSRVKEGLAFEGERTDIQKFGDMLGALQPVFSAVRALSIAPDGTGRLAVVCPGSFKGRTAVFRQDGG